MGISELTYETDEGYRVAVAARQLLQQQETVTAKQVAEEGGVPILVASLRLQGHVKYKIFQKASRNEYVLGPEFEAYHSFYRERYNAPY